ncbi:MAG: hypothetical protein FJZ01_26815, partial [Candidatus Sericytochromatia bacterium]|nr:hypothetical protein [Candidatus Tanganyikabacteria bacterium]
MSDEKKPGLGVEELEERRAPRLGATASGLMAGGETDMTAEAPQGTEASPETVEQMERWLADSGTSDQPVEGYAQPGEGTEAPGETIDATFDPDKFMAPPPPPPEGIIDPLFKPDMPPPEGHYAPPPPPPE